MAHWITLQQQSGLQDFIFVDIIYHTHTHVWMHFGLKVSQQWMPPTPPLLLLPTLNPLLCAFSSSSCWSLGTMAASLSIPGTEPTVLIWKVRWPLRSHWPCACKWREQIARPILKAAMVSSAEQRHCNLGVTMTPSVLPPAVSLRSYISQMILWTEKCFSYHISSVVRPHLFWQAVPLLWGKHEVCCSTVSAGQHCATR